MWLVSKLLTLGLRNEKDNKYLIIPVFFLKLIVRLCTNRIGNILHTDCIALHMTPNMVNITQLHGYMKRERLELESDMINNMNGPMTLAPRY